MSRGNKVFAAITPQIAESVSSDLAIRDLFLHALFARIALNDGNTIEFETIYNKNTNIIDLEIPEKLLPLLNEITGMQRGAKLTAFINWLIGSKNLGGGTIETQTITEIDISSDINIFSHIYNGVSTTLTSRIKITNTGDGTYTISFFINGVAILPHSTLTVDGGGETVIFQSKGIYVETGDLITIDIIGPIVSTNVDTEVILSL